MRCATPPTLGSVRVRKICEIDGEELADADIAQGVTTPDGRAVTDADLADLPLPTAHTIEIAAFIEVRDVDPRRLRRPYLLAARPGGAKAYVLMREALRRSARQPSLRSPSAAGRYSAWSSRTRTPSHSTPCTGRTKSAPPTGSRRPSRSASTTTKSPRRSS